MAGAGGVEPKGIVFTGVSIEFCGAGTVVGTVIDVAGG